MTSRWTTSRREALQALGVAVAGSVGVSTAGGQDSGLEATIAFDPDQVTVTAGSTVDVDVVVLGAEEGIGAYEFELTVDPAVVTFEEITLDRGESTSKSEIEDDGETAVFGTALLDNAYTGAPEITIGSVTLRGESGGQSSLAFAEIFGVRSVENNPYDTTGERGEVTVNSAQTPSAAFDVTPAEPVAGEPATFDASDSTGNITEYRWDLTGDGTVDTTTTDPQTDFTYESAGDRTVTLTVEDGDGDTDQAGQTVTVRDTPQLDAALDVEPTDPETGESVTFDAGGSTGDIVEYRWDLTGDGTVDTTTTDPQTNFTYGEAGDRTVTVTVENADGDTDQASETVTVTESTTLTAAFDVTPADPETGESVTFDAAGSTGDIVEYRWDLTGDGTVDTTTTDPQTAFTYSSGGDRTVSLTVEDPEGNTDQTSRTVTVTDPATLTAVFDVDPAEPTTSDVVTFDASGSTGDIVEYRWDLTGDGTVDATTTDPTLTRTYDDAGDRTVTLTVESAAGDTDQAGQTVTVTDPTPLAAAFEAEPAEPAVGESVTFDASGSTGDIVEYRWDLTGDGTVDTTTTDPQTAFTYDSAGDRTVTLTVEGAGGDTDQAGQTLAVTAPPAPEASLSATPTDPGTGESVTFDASGSTGDIVEYRWDLTGDGTVDTTTDGPTTTRTYEDAGTRVVELQVVDTLDRTASATVEVAVTDPLPAPEAAFEVAPSEPEPGETVTFDAAGSTGDIVEYYWVFGEGTEEPTEEPVTTHVYDDPGTVTVELTVTDSAGQEATATQTLEISAGNTGDGDGSPGDGNGTDDGDGGDDGSPGDGNGTDGGDGGNDGSPDDGNGTDGSGPGFGPASALAGLGGAAYLLRQRLLGDDERE